MAREARRRRQSRQRPHGHGAEQRRLISKPPFGHFREPGIAGIPERYQYIADKAMAPRALYRRARKKRPEGGVVEIGELRKFRTAQFGARLKGVRGAGLGELVPRADGQAIVAAINMITHCGAELRRDMALMLDGEVGNTAPGIEPVGRRQRPCGTGIKACPATAAMVCGRSVGW